MVVAVPILVVVVAVILVMLLVVLLVLLVLFVRMPRRFDVDAPIVIWTPAARRH
jgi:hypothetical protein